MAPTRMDEPFIALDDPAVRVRLRITARARRFTLRLDPARGDAVLTMPPGVPLPEARMFLMGQSGWLARALARTPRPIVVAAGTRLPVAGEEVEICLSDGPRRAAEDQATVTPWCQRHSATPQRSAARRNR